MSGVSSGDVARFHSYVEFDPNGGCWLWSGHTRGSSSHEYGGFNFSGRRTTSAHRAAWEIFNGPPPPAAFVCHKCDVPQCVNPAHLFLGDNRANVDDMVAKGRNTKGERHGMARLTARQVEEIRTAPGLFREIGAGYGIHRTMVSLIKRGLRWRSEVARETTETPVRRKIGEQA